ncbi:hypothetical protein NBRC111894_4139 [Sporolactobacillus inulinus]|uniref:Uncharacterized protein n=1 Tax=Sporolactobacillus inulinus TaxID=2078 RepID=A0A4Y1ZHH1_9BACL|nr:hypothetical protein NBRC111894_4139 [Sporolactobacillus inulinus]
MLHLSLLASMSLFAGKYTYLFKKREQNSIANAKMYRKNLVNEQLNHCP